MKLIYAPWISNKALSCRCPECPTLHSIPILCAAASASNAASQSPIGDLGSGSTRETKSMPTGFRANPSTSRLTSEPPVIRCRVTQSGPQKRLLVSAAIDTEGCSAGSPIPQRLDRGAGQAEPCRAGRPPNLKASRLRRASRAHQTARRAGLRIPAHPATHSDNIRPPVPGYPATCDALP